MIPRIIERLARLIKQIPSGLLPDDILLSEFDAMVTNFITGAQAKARNPHHPAPASPPVNPAPAPSPAPSAPTVPNPAPAAPPVNSAPAPSLPGK